MTATLTAAPDLSLAAREWNVYMEALAPLGERTAALVSDPQDPLLRQEMYRFLFAQISAAYMGVVYADTAHPDFWPYVNQVYNSLGPNPDDVYYMAPIDGDGVYKLSGFRGTVQIIDFQIASGLLMPRGVGQLGAVTANYDIDTLNINAADGAFEVVLSEERPAGYQGDWWKLDPGSTYIFVRQVSCDWLNEIDGRLAIERLDRPAVKPRPDAKAIEASLRQIAEWAENYTKLSSQWLGRLAGQGLINKVTVRDLADVGGLSTQMYVEGLFDLQPDEALILETDVPKEFRYWNFQLTDMLWGSVDWVNRQSHINHHTGMIDKDGKLRIVISADDPGIPNWLDTGGYAKGEIIGRWKHCSSAPQPTIIKVKVAEVRKHLPADTPVVTLEARDAAIRLRRKGAQLRRRW